MVDETKKDINGIEGKPQASQGQQGLGDLGNDKKVEKHSVRRVEARRLKGFRDFLPEAMETRLAVIDAIRTEARIFGFRSIATPALEYAETLLGIGEETDKQSYRFTDHGGRQVGLRFDLTVPFARFVAEHQGELAFPFKKLQIGEVWRGENTQKGRYREFGQCDLDIIGTESPMADAEILTLFARILNKLQFGPFTIGVSSRTVLSGLMGLFFRDSLKLETKILVAVDKLGKIGKDGVMKLLVEELGLDEGASQSFLALLAAKDEVGETPLNPIRELFRKSEAQGFSEAKVLLLEVEKLSTIVARARRGFDVHQGQKTLERYGKIKVDLSIARGLGYYTGTVFESTIDSLPGFGSICSGGRYDDLVKRFVDRDLPGIGGSIGLDRLVSALEELGLTKSDLGEKLFVAVASADAWDYGFDLVSEIRSYGWTCELGFATKIGAQLKHADRIEASKVFIVGGEELMSQTFTLKDMKVGTQEQGILRARLGEVLQSLAKTNY